jgi:hypothetical protein
VENLNEWIQVLQLKEPLDFRYSVVYHIVQYARARGGYRRPYAADRAAS